MGNLKDAVIKLIGKRATPTQDKEEREPLENEPASKAEETELKRGEEFLDPTLTLAGVKSEHVTPIKREDWLKQYNLKEETEKEKAETKAEEQRQLQAGLQSRDVAAGAVNQDELTLEMGGIPQKGIVKRIEHPTEDVEKK